MRMALRRTRTNSDLDPGSGSGSGPAAHDGAGGAGRAGAGGDAFAEGACGGDSVPRHLISLNGVLISWIDLSRKVRGGTGAAAALVTAWRDGRGSSSSDSVEGLVAKTRESLETD